MSRWFRLYEDMLDDPKVQLLSPELFKTWVNLLALASRHKGKLPAVGHIAFALRISAHDAQSRLDDLILAGLIDIRPAGGLEPHNWSARQWASDDSAERVRRHRARKKASVAGATENDEGNQRTQDVTVTVTAPDSYTEKKKESSSPLPPSRRRDEGGDFSDFWKRGRGGGDPLDRLAERMAGLGMDASPIVATTRQASARNPSAYFTRLAVGEIQRRLPNLDEGLIRDALWGRGNAYGTLCNLMLMAEA